MALQLKSMSDGASGGVFRKLLLGVVAVVLAVVVLRGVIGTIATGNVGVRRCHEPG
jgi:ABC-type transporter Mla maintaining outer membrane lipid asymmetry permease subunit MlaE